MATLRWDHFKIASEKIFSTFSMAMAISNELSSEIAAALLDKKKTPNELKQLREIILEIHATLQKMQQHTSPKSSKPMAGAAKQSSEE